jgi:hypothetical protein
MCSMKTDMGGAAGLLSAFECAVKLGCRQRLYAVCHESRPPVLDVSVTTPTLKSQLHSHAPIVASPCDVCRYHCTLVLTIQARKHPTSKQSAL